MSDTKVYRATLSLGKSTDTYDASGKILEEKEVGQISQAQVIDVLNSFLGKSKQKPPIYSAIKVNGKKLYEYARNGEEVEIKERDIEIMMIELIDFQIMRLFSMLNVLKEPIFVLYVLILLKTRVSRTYVSSRKKTGRALFNY